MELKYILTREAYNNMLSSNNSEIEVNSNENLTEFINEYKSKKGTLETIYDSFESREELLSKLYSSGFIEDNKTLSFKNPLLGLHAKYSNNVRKSKELNNKIEEYTKNLNDLGTDLSDESLKTEKESINNILKDLKEQISELAKVITTNQKEVNDKLNEMIEKSKK